VNSDGRSALTGKSQGGYASVDRDNQVAALDTLGAGPSGKKEGDERQDEHDNGGANPRNHVSRSASP
jgi:hypothetical protein